MKCGYLYGAILIIGITGCSPTVKMQAPDKPIEINLNVKIDHEIRVKVDKDLEQLFEKQSDIF